jgi:hypothetical protein
MNLMIRKLVIFVCFCVTLAGCSEPAVNKPAFKPSDSQYDIAIENLSVTTEKLDSIRKEKDLFVKSLEDFEQQQSDYPRFWNANRIQLQYQHFAVWHKDIAIRERNLEVQHALNTLAAHNQVMKRKMNDPNLTTQGLSLDVKQSSIQ